MELVKSGGIVEQDAQLIKNAQSSYKLLKRPPVVLEEDEYVDGLSAVVKKRFFPTLAKNSEEGSPDFATSARNSSRQPAPSTEKTDLTLCEYQARYTSEDNASFLEILDKQNLLRREKHAWHYNDNKIYSQNVIHHQQRLEAQQEEIRKNIGWIDERGSATGWRSQPKNALIFQPDGVEDNLADDTGRVTIRYEATRMSPDSGVPDSTADDVSLGAGDLDDLDEPRVNGYTFVDEPDTPATQTANPFGESSVPSRSILKENPFRIAETPARDQLHERLLEKTRRASTNRIPTGIRRTIATPKFKSSPKLSPAAQRFMTGSSSLDGLRERLKTPAKESRLR